MQKSPEDIFSSSFPSLSLEICGIDDDNGEFILAQSTVIITTGATEERRSKSRYILIQNKLYI